MSNSFETLWTEAHQAPLSIGFLRQEYWSGLPFTSPGDHNNPGIEIISSSLQACSLALSLKGSKLFKVTLINVKKFESQL